MLRTISSSLIAMLPKRLFGSNQMMALGRWGIECEKGKAILADRANEDHCGPCGFNGPQDVEKIHKQINENINFYKNRNQ